MAKSLKGMIAEEFKMKANKSYQTIISRPTLMIALMLLVLCASAAHAQTTEFTYQGKLTDGSNAANGNYDFEFRLFDASSGGGQQGATVQRLNVAVASGIFTVQLDFGGGVFSGLPRFLEIGVRVTGNPDPFTLLAPRQPVTSTPYSVRSLNSSVADTLSSACVGCVTSTQVGSVLGSAITGQVPLSSVPAGSASYVHNTTSQQDASNFNISGTGTANVFNAALQFNIGGNRILSVAGTSNVFAGSGAGTSNTTGGNNAFFGTSAGTANTGGAQNAFFGTQAGASNTTELGNSFFGFRAGFVNTANGNSFFGNLTGSSNTTGTNNSFFGEVAGRSNTTGADNSFFGTQAGKSTTTGSRNSFFGYSAAGQNTTGTDNAVFGNHANEVSTTGSFNAVFGNQAGQFNGGDNNAFFGHRAGFTNDASENSFFGFQAGLSNTTGNANNFFGANAGSSTTTGSFNNFFGNNAGGANGTGSFNAFFGNEAGKHNTTGRSNSFFGTGSGYFNSTGTQNTFIGDLAGETNISGENNTMLGSGANPTTGSLNYATAIGAGSVANQSNSIFLGRPDGSDAVRIPGSVVINGTLVVSSLGSAGSTSICLNAASRISPCSSSLRYKTSVRAFAGGLDIVRHLRPITFNWKDDGKRDVGFAAEEVAKIDSLLTTLNDKGEVEGVKYGQLTTVLVNAVKEQQEQIAAQQRLIEQQQQQLKHQQDTVQALTRIVCRKNRHAEVCK